MNTNHVNIICLYWVGEFRGRDFSEDDVWRLFENVSYHTDRPFSFYTLTNDMKASLPGGKIELRYAWPGWWSKMELHRPDLPEGRTLYLDLDSHVIRNLQPILDTEGDLVMFPTDVVGKKQLTNDGWLIPRYQAATMLFDPGVMSWIWDTFVKCPEAHMSRFRSDQDVMAEWIPDQSTFPIRWMRKLKKCSKTDPPPEDVIIVTGQPGNGDFRRPELYTWLELMTSGKEAQ